MAPPRPEFIIIRHPAETIQLQPETPSRKRTNPSQSLGAKSSGRTHRKRRSKRTYQAETLHTLKSSLPTRIRNELSVNSLTQHKVRPGRQVIRRISIKSPERPHKEIPHAKSLSTYPKIDITTLKIITLNTGGLNAKRKRD